uniref:Transcriptional regulator, HxlR family n=1 Tax=Caulobacter sp. (strain K31) TaxID=366602 RepID=B0T917_CAUSK
MDCPIALGLESVGEWWSILILRDAFYGLTRFDQFQKSLQIAPNMLTRRLKALVASGLLEQRLYSARRRDYVLTDRGREFWPVLVTLHAWGERHFAQGPKAVVLVEAASGAEASPQLVDRRNGKALAADAYAFKPGPGSQAVTKPA